MRPTRKTIPETRKDGDSVHTDFRNHKGEEKDRSSLASFLYTVRLMQVLSDVDVLLYDNTTDAPWIAGAATQRIETSTT